MLADGVVEDVGCGGAGPDGHCLSPSTLVIFPCEMWGWGDG